MSRQIELIALQTQLKEVLSSSLVEKKEEMTKMAAEENKRRLNCSNASNELVRLVDEVYTVELSVWRKKKDCARVWGGKVAAIKRSVKEFGQLRNWFPSNSRVDAKQGTTKVPNRASRQGTRLLSFRGYRINIPASCGKFVMNQTVPCPGCGEHFAAYVNPRQAKYVVYCSQYIEHCLGSCKPYEKIGRSHHCAKCRQSFLGSRSYGIHLKTCRGHGSKCSNANAQEASV